MKNNQVRLKYLLIPVLLVIGIVTWKDSRSYDHVVRVIKRQIVSQSINCSGKNIWLQNIAKHSIAQPSQYLPTSISVAYRDYQGNITTCVMGWNDKFFGKKKTDTSTSFMLASITKVFTADVILSLINNNQLAFNDKLVDLLPELSNLRFTDERIKLITVQDLLMHRAGFDRHRIGVGDKMYGKNPLCPNNIEKLQTELLQFVPNQKMVYSNLGFCLLSRIAEEKYQMPYRDIIRQKYHLHNYKNFDFIDNASQLPDNHMIILPEILSLDYQAMSSWAGLYSNPSELLNVIVTGINTQRQSTVWQKPPGLNCKPTITQGCPVYMGYRYATDDSLTLYWRDGSMPNASALLVMDDKGGSLSIVTNVRRSSYMEQELVKEFYQYRLQNKL